MEVDELQPHEGGPQEVLLRRELDFEPAVRTIASYYAILQGNGAPLEKFQHVKTPDCLSAPNLPQLNCYQIQAVARALVSPLCLIQGPPGTGKTVTSATLVYHLVKQHRGQVLVCAPSNIVVDQLAEKINATSSLSARAEGSQNLLEVARGRELQRGVPDAAQPSAQPRHSEVREAAEVLPAAGRHGRVVAEGREGVPQAARPGGNVACNSREILKSADVICSTCVTSSDPRLRDFLFRHVVIDEATQAIESECLLPMLKGAKQVILVGDHRQLGPVITCREIAKAGLNKSLFERLVQIGIRPIRLQVQYRMHPELSIFPSNTFYEGLA